MEKNRDFRWDLKLGQIAEDWLADLLQSRTIEVKRDFKASQTGKVFVEFFCRGKPSGIATTEAEYWAFILDGDSVVILPTEKVKNLVSEAQEKGKVASGGDGNLSQGALIKLERLLK